MVYFRFCFATKKQGRPAKGDPCIVLLKTSRMKWKKLVGVCIAAVIWTHYTLDRTSMIASSFCWTRLSAADRISGKAWWQASSAGPHRRLVSEWSDVHKNSPDRSRSASWSSGNTCVQAFYDGIQDIPYWEPPGLQLLWLSMTYEERSLLRT